MTDAYVSSFFEHREALARLPEIEEEVRRAGDLIVACLQRGSTILLCGNGGSATDAEHLAGEFVGRFERERAAWPAIALGSSLASLTSVANDYGYEEAFARGVRAHAGTAGLLIALSTSGNSANVVRGVEEARERAIPVVGMTGEAGGRLALLSSVAVQVPATVTARVQEMHLLIGHAWCRYAEAILA